MTETMKGYMYENHFDLMLMKITVSVMTPYNYSNGQFFFIGKTHYCENVLL